MSRTKQAARKRSGLLPRNALKRKRAAREAKEGSSSTFEGFSPPVKQSKLSDEQEREIEGRVSKKQKLGTDSEDEGDEEEVETGDRVRAVPRSKKEEPLTLKLLSKKQRKNLRKTQRHAAESSMPDEDEVEDVGEDEDESEVKKQDSSTQLDDELRGKGLTSRERKRVKGAFAQAALDNKVYEKTSEVATDNGLKEDIFDGSENNGTDSDVDMRAGEQSSTKFVSKKAKKKLEKQAKKSNRQVLDEEEENSMPRTRDEETIDESIAQMDPPLLADHYAKHIKRHIGDLSTIELHNKYLPSVAFLDTTAFKKPHLRKHLRAYITASTNGGHSALQETSAEKGSPHTLVIAASGLRASHLNNALHSLAMPPKTKTAKLFAKHTKLSEHLTFLEITRVTVGTGTPERLIQLLEKDALKTANLKRIVIDASYLDAKQRSIFDMEETFVPLVKLLARVEIKSRLGKGVQVLVF